MDLLQAAHTMSGVEMAMWDLLGKARGEPVWKLLGYARSHPKTPYASVLFGDAPQATLEHARRIRADGFRGGKVRLGPDRPRQRGGGLRPADGRARGPGA